MNEREHSQRQDRIWNILGGMLVVSVSAIMLAFAYRIAF